METRASYILVGTFVLGFLVAAFAAVIWLAGVDLDERSQEYDIFFEGSVSGLKVGNPVRYRGIPVGIVRDMRINPDNVEEVQVTIEVPESTPIKEDATASLEFQGVTGVAYVQISGGSNEAPRLAKASGGDRPVIPSTPSQIQEVIEQAPELINQFIGLVDEARGIMNEENRRNLETTLANLAQFSGAMADSSGDIQATLAETASAIQQLRGTAAEAETVLATLSQRGDGIADRLETTLDNANGLAEEAGRLVAELRPVVQSAGETFDSVGAVADDVRPHAGPIAEQAEAALRDARTITQDLKAASQNIASAADEAAVLLRDAREPVNTFTNTGLYEFTQLVVEMRTLVASLSRITNEIERDPARFFFGDKTQGFETE
jgi:phospholipid/cholesterol/gamma-HCH transport system substrate-binding protein